jgi:GT2 family glycosyltransferase
VASDVVWWPAGPGVSRGSVAALTVSYNTWELTGFLLWSLRTIVSWPELEIVVVDNGSRDGSAQLLAEAGLPRSTPPGTAPIPSMSGLRTTTPRTSPEFPARTSDTTPCCRNSVKRRPR